MRVVHCTDSMVYAGTEAHILTLAAEQRRQGTEVAILCPGGSVLAARARDLGLRVHAAARRAFIDPGLGVRMSRLLMSGGADILHAHNGQMNLHAALAIALARRGRLVTTQHFIEPARLKRSGPKAALANLLHRWVQRRCSAAVAISQAVATAAIQRGDFPVERVHVVPNGVGDPLTGFSRRTRSEWRTRLGLPEIAKIVLCPARLEKEKSVETLLAALPDVRRQVPELLCLFAGEGRLRPDLEGLAAGLGLGGVVRFLGRRDDLGEWMAAADAVVLPSAAEPFGLVLIEAMGFGRAVVAAQAGGPLEIVREDVNGAFFQPENPADLTKVLSVLLVDDVRLDRLGAGGRADYLDRFTASRMAGAIQEVYEKVAG